MLGVSTLEECLEAVQKDGDVLEFVPEQWKTDSVCLAAVQQNGVSVYYVPENKQTPELCLMAVSIDGWALEGVSNRMKTH